MKTARKESENSNSKSSYQFMATNGHFISPNGTIKTTSTMLKEITDFINADPTSFYSLIIGSDSQTRKTNGRSEIDFVTAVIIYRKGRGAKYYWHKVKKHQKPILRDKIYTETLMSLDVAEHIVPEVGKRISPENYDLEIHIDVGPLGKTREMIKDVVGMVNGNGYIAQTKPNSWGASSVADKHT